MTTLGVWLTRWPLRYSVPLLLLAVATLGGAATFTHERELEQVRIREDALRQLRNFASLEAQTVREQLVKGNLAGVRALVARLALDASVTRAALTSSTGVVLASTRLAELGTQRPLSPPSAATLNVSLAGTEVRAVVSLHAHAASADETLGQLEIVRDIAPRLEASAARQRSAFLRFFVYFLGVSLLLWGVFERLVWRRILALGMVAQRVAGGDLDARADERGGDEIAVAGRMGNRAADQLRLAHAINARLTRALERLAAAAPGPTLFDELAAAALEGTDARWALVMRVLPRSDDLLVVGAAGDTSAHRAQRASFAGTPCHAALSAAERFQLEETAVGERWPGIATWCRGDVAWSRTVALEGRDGVRVGVLWLVGDRARVPTAADAALLGTAADRITQEFARADQEAQLREREQRLELAMRVGDVSITEWDIDADRVDVRGNWLERFPLSSGPGGRLRAQDWLDAIHPDERPAIARIHEAMRSGTPPPDALDFRMRARDGGWRWVRGHAGAVTSGIDGAPRIAVSVLADVHDLIAKEQELRASESQLRLAMEAGELCVADWYPATDELRLSDWWLRELGYADEEVGHLRADFVRLVEPGDAVIVGAWLAAHLRGEAPIQPVEFRLRRKDGSWQWTRLQARVTERNDSGRATRMTGVFANIDPARKAEESLRERTEFLELAVRGTADGLWDWAPLNDAFYLSPRGCELLGLVDAGLPRQLAGFVERTLSGSQREHLLAEVARVRAGLDYVDFELQMRTGTGALRWYRIKGVAVRDQHGEVRRVVGSISDVNDARERELELAQARQLTSEAIESLDAGLLRLDANDRIVLINSRYLELYGLPRDRRYVGMTLRDMVELYFKLHPTSLEGRSIDEAVRERMRLHREQTGSWEIRVGGRWILVSDIMTSDGGRVCLRTDVTAIKNLQKELNSRTEYLELVVRGTSDGLWSWDGDHGNDLYLSPRVYDLFGYEPGDIPTALDRFEETLYHPEDAVRIRAIVAHMAAHPEEGDILSCEVRFKCGDGQYRWFHNRAAMTRRPDGRVHRFAGSVSNVHERRLREQELVEARQQLSDAIEAIDSGLMISDRDDRLVLCNRRYREMYQFAEELVRPGTPIAELARDLMIRHPDYRRGKPLEEAVADRIAQHRARLGRWELELGGRWYQIGDYETDAGGVVSLRTDITHLKQVERVLRERTEFLEAAVRGSMDGIYAVDLIADTAWFAPRFHELLGFADGELSTTWSEFAAAHFHPEEAEARAAALARVASRDAEFVSREMRLKRKDGSWGWYHGRAAVVRDANGEPHRLIGSLSDTGERHRREDELAEARQQLQDAIESLDVGIVMFDRDERFVLCNRRFREMVGDIGLALEPGVRYADAVRAYYAANPAQRGGAELDAIVATRVAEFREQRGTFVQQRGERWVQVANFSTADGGVVSLRSDITAIKRTEQALRESEARLRTVFDNSPLGIFLAGTNGAIVFRNRLFAEITGAADREWRKHAWLGHVHEDERAWIGARWYEYVAAATGAFDIEYRTSEIPERVVRLRAAPITEQGHTLGFAGTLEDISAQRQAEIEQHRLQLQLQQAQKMDAIGHLTGGIAHDFNNILASILGYAALAGERRATQDDAKLVTYLDAIRQSGERARELVAKMLAFSRSEPREVVTPTAIQPLVTEAVKLLKAIIPANIHIVTVCEPQMPPVLVDGVDLHQAIVNLAVNARDAIGGHGQITIAVRAPRLVKDHCASCRESFADRYVEIAVTDTGGGIAPEHLPRLFDPFFSTKEVGKGTGMGLAVTHGVVHRVGGHILVETAPGKGTTMRLLLRSAQTVVRAVPNPAASQVPALPRTARVLVVDDEPLVMGLISEVLEGRGYDAIGFTDSRQALAWARSPEGRFDLLVTDQTMPGLTGVELARELLAMRPMLPIVLCTGFSESVDARVAAAMGIRHFFSKPIPLERLVAAVDTLLSDGPAPAIVA